MNFKEFLGISTDNNFPAGRTLDLGAISFDSTLLDENAKMPHDEMAAAYRMFNNRPMINSSVKQYCRFIVGREVSFVSADQRSQDFANAWLKQRKHLRRDVYHGAILGVSLGNAYFENCYVESASGQPFFDNVFLVDDPSRVYININRKTDDEYWLYQVPVEMRHFTHRGIVYTPSYFLINYVVGSYVGRKVVFAVALHKDKLKHFKFGLSRDGIYGRSFLASALDNDEAMSQIITSIAKISKYKSVGTKLISFFDDNGEVRTEDIEKFEEDVEARKYEDMILINKKHQVTSLSHVGEYDSMMNELDFFRKENYSGILPTFLTPWGGETKYTNAGEIKIPFQLDIASVQQDYLEFLDELITEPLKRQHSLAADLHLKFDHIDLETRSDKMAYIGDMYKDNVITLNERRKAAGFEPVENGDKFAYQVAPTQLPESPNHGAAGGDDSEQSFSLPNASASSSFLPAPLAGLSEKYCCNHTLKEAFVVNDSDDTWRKRIVKFGQASAAEAKDFSIVRKNTVGGKVVRLVRSADGGAYAAYNGSKFLKSFLGDEREAAIAYFERQGERLKELKDTIEQGETPEDLLADAMFDEVNDALIAAMDEFFADFNASKVKKEAFGVDPSILAKLQAYFDKFSFATKAIIGGVVAKMFANLYEPDDEAVDAGEDTDVAPEDVKTKDALEQAKAMIQQRMEGELDKYKATKLQDVRRTILDGIAAGKTHAAIKAEIKDDVTAYKRKPNVFDFETRRIVRTEVGGSSTLAKLIKWYNQGYEWFEWITMDDNRVREDHVARHRNVYKILDALQGKIPFPGGSLVPGEPNINCRCSAVLYV